jgi:hypothetical protein
VKRLGLGDPYVPAPVFKVLCGSFTGPNSQTMVVSLAGPTSILGWAVFSWTGGEWQLLMKQSQAAVLTAAGSDIRETVSIYRAGDPRCCPSGGEKSRLWHWNGSRFTAGVWKQAAPAKAAPTVHLYYFLSPSHNILCGLGDEGAADCKSWNPPQRAYMKWGGTLEICKGSRCAGQPLTKAEIKATPVLEYGQRNDYAGYRCRSETTGITCTKLAPGKAHGKGFLISRSGIKRVGP